MSKPVLRFTRSSRPEPHSEAGVSLILVLVFILVGSLIVVGLAEMTTNDLHNTGNFASARSLSYDATSAVDVAVQSIRYTPLLSSSETLNASPPGACWPTIAEGGTWQYGEPTSPLPNTGGNDFYVWCSTSWTPTSSATRVVTLSACQAANASENLTTQATACASHPLVQAVVTFDDYPNGVATPTEVPCQPPSDGGYCGTTETVDSWLYYPTTPTITNVGCPTPSTPCSAEPIAGGTSFTITGTGFVTGSTVDFIEESNGTPTSDNVVLAASNVDVVSGTSITATSPAITEGTKYFVTVTTPVGTNAYNGNDIFTYSAVTPAVTEVWAGRPTTGANGQQTCPTSGSSSGQISGGIEVTVCGTGFWGTNLSTPSDAPVVAFVNPTSDVTVDAQYVNVISNTLMTITLPAEYQVAPSAAFYVVVSTPDGTSPESTTFTYVGMVPTVESVTYSSSSQTVTISGTGFVTGDRYSVGFDQESNCANGTTYQSSSSVTVSSATSITASVPSLTNNDTYFVTVTSPSGTSTCYPTFVYTS